MQLDSRLKEIFYTSLKKSQFLTQYIRCVYVQIIFVIFNLLLPRAQLRYSWKIYQLQRSTREVRIRAPRCLSFDEMPMLWSFKFIFHILRYVKHQ